MIKTQIQLRPAQHRHLQDIARRRHISMAEAIRQSVDEVLDRTNSDSLWERARSSVGRHASKHRDVSAKHDRHLANIWSR